MNIQRGNLGTQKVTVYYLFLQVWCVTSLFSSSLRSKATKSATNFSKLRKSITMRSGFFTQKRGNFSFVVTVPESSQRRRILWNAIEIPLNSKDVLSSYFKISFFPVLDRKKTYEIVTIFVCVCFRCLSLSLWTLWQTFT